MITYKDFNILNESILDSPRKTLSPEIWDKKNNKYILKTDVKKQIIQRLNKLLKDFDLSLNEISELYIVGSITGYRYNEKSDIDVNVTLDITDEVHQNILNSLLKYNEKNLKNTQHPVNFYITKSNMELKTGDFIYDIIHDTWKSQPKEIIADIDYMSVMTLALSECHAIDNDEDELRRDLIDFILLKHDLKEIYYLNIPEKETKDMLKKKELEIYADLDNLKKRYIQLHNFRISSFTDINKTEYLTKIKTNIKDNNFTINNIVWKILERYGYIERLKLYLQVHKELLNKEKIDIKIINNLKSIFKMEFS